MTNSDVTLFKIAIDAEFASSLKRYLLEAADEEGIDRSAITIEDADPAPLQRSLEFEPFSIATALYVGNIILGGVAGHFITKGLDRILKEKEKPVIVIAPSGELLRLDPEKPEELKEMLERLRKAAG